MNIKCKYCLVLLIILTSAVRAQKQFVVYHVSGMVNIITGDKSSPAVRGNVITKKDHLQVKLNAGCMLIAPGGKSKQVSEAGTWSFDELQQIFAKEKTNEVTRKFFAYVYDNFFSSHKSEPLAVTPVVFRGDKLMLLPSDHSIILSDAVIFTWKKPVMRTPLRLTIKDESEKIILDTVLRKTTSLQANFPEFGIIPKQVYQWKIEESDTRQPQNYFLHFLVADKKQGKKIIKDLKILQDKKLPMGIRRQIEQDIFEKWRSFYQPGKDE